MSYVTNVKDASVIFLTYNTFVDNVDGIMAGHIMYVTTFLLTLGNSAVVYYINNFDP